MLKLHVQPVEALLTQPTAARRRTEMVMLTVWLDVDPCAVRGAVSRQHYAYGPRGGERAHRGCDDRAIFPNR